MDERPTHLDLFSGIGGFALAAQWAGFRTIGFCEIDKYCQKVLAKNFLADSDFTGCEAQRICDDGCGNKTKLRCYPNIFDLDGRQFKGVSLITGGFPCQPFSVAGKRRGAADDRAIWPQMFRVISEARPAWVVGENVPGIIPMELDNVLSDLERIGYACRPFVIPACAVDARHRRDRLWVVGRRNPGSGSMAYSEAERFQESQQRELPSEPNCPGSRERRFADESSSDSGRKWLLEPGVGRVAHGIPSRVDRLKGLGNAIVPQVAYEILREIRNLPL